MFKTSFERGKLVQPTDIRLNNETDIHQVDQKEVYRYFGNQGKTSDIRKKCFR